MDREPAVAGRFYTDDAATLVRQVDRFLAAGGPRVRARGLVAPHAGYVYSGAGAGAVYARVDVPKRVIVLGPNHTGLGKAAALWPGGTWHLPSGDVPVDAALTAALAASPLVEADPEAHLLEHSLEVQLPFLARARPDVAIAALCLGPLSYEQCEELGNDVAAAAREAGALVVASSDMSHYVPAAVARRQDGRALDRVLALDARGLHRVVHEEAITMCGVVPATVMLAAARVLGARSAKVVRYATSGDVTGDDASVVGYAGAVVA